MPRNVLLEVDPFPGKTMEVWHLDPRGDLREYQFYLQKGCPLDLLEREVIGHAETWFARRGRQGDEVERGTVRASGPHQPLEFDKLDLDLYTIVARFKRAKPEIRQREEMDRYLGLEAAKTQSTGAIHANIAAGGDVEAQARSAVASQKAAGAARKAWDEDEKFRRDNGLPAFTPETPKELDE